VGLRGRGRGVAIKKEARVVVVGFLTPSSSTLVEVKSWPLVGSVLRLRVEVPWVPNKCRVHIRTYGTINI